VSARPLETTFDVNLKGTLFTVQRALPLLWDRAFDHPQRIVVASKGFAP
jgi:NAD(P)-dependent dehydrogenase (short-subunit alcohol dehydrogenase family)